MKKKEKNKGIERRERQKKGEKKKKREQGEEKAQGRERGGFRQKGRRRNNDTKAIGHSNEARQYNKKRYEKGNGTEKRAKKLLVSDKKRDCDDAQPRNIYYIYNV